VDDARTFVDVILDALQTPPPDLMISVTHDRLLTWAHQIPPELFV
jgi:hypothetical protein